jgi:predicted metal-dependent phosphoesterase TrpH
MSSIIDLHTHTVCSDGTLTPAELIARADTAAVRVLALTDHDATDGLADAGRAAVQRGMTLVPGVEVSVTWQRQTVHVVGLGIDHTNEPLQRGLARLREFRGWRAQEIDRRLRRKNIHGAFEHVRANVKGAILSRTHFARFLVSQGYVSDMGQAFRQYLARGKAAHVPGQWATIEEAVGWISGAGGTAVIAHPARYKLTSGKLKRLLNEFKECGGRAIEVVSGSHAPQENAQFARIAAEHGLLGSLGSDYHGPENPWVDLGRLPMLPNGCAPVWEDGNLAIQMKPQADAGERRVANS